MKSLFYDSIAGILGHAAKRQLLSESLTVHSLGWALGYTEMAKGAEIVRNAVGDYGVVLYLSRSRKQESALLWEPPGQIIIGHKIIPADAKFLRVGNDVVITSGFDQILAIKGSTSDIPSMFSEDQLIEKLWHGIGDDELAFHKYVQRALNPHYEFWVEHSGRGYAVPRALSTVNRASHIFTAITHKGVLLPEKDRLHL